MLARCLRVCTLICKRAALAGKGLVRVRETNETRFQTHEVLENGADIDAESNHPRFAIAVAHNQELNICLEITNKIFINFCRFADRTQQAIPNKKCPTLVLLDTHSGQKVSSLPFPFMRLLSCLRMIFVGNVID